MKRSVLLTCLSLALTAPTLLLAQSPTAPALGFNVFLQNGATLKNNETEGAVAMGGDLTLDGSYQVATNTPGTFQVGGVNIGLLIGGKVIYSAGNDLQVNSNSYVKIGDPTNSYVWYKDQNNAFSPIRITNGQNYNGNPKIALQANSQNLNVSATNNPVFQSGLINFANQFAALKNNAVSMSLCPDNATITNPNGQTIPHTNLPNQVKITLNNGINVLNLTGADMNNVQNFTFNNQPSASRVLIVNVNAPGTFNWAVWTNGGVGGSNGEFVLFNFYNTTTLNIQGNGGVIGTVFAPYAAITKTANQQNIDGQVIAQSYFQNGGENHPYNFSPSVPGCGATLAANYTINNNAQCLSNNSFTFTNTSTGTGTLTYAWNFGDGTTSTSTSPTKAYAAAGTYSIKLKTTSGTTSDSVTKTVTVYGTPVKGYAVNNNTQALPTNSFVFTSTTPTTGNTYSWSFGDGTTSTSANPTKVYSATGTYTVKQKVTSTNGCKDSVSSTVTVVAGTAANYTINNSGQCYNNNSFTFTNTSTGGGALTYEWNFGDGTTSAATSPVKVYAAAGTYSVKLKTTSGTTGVDSITKTVSVYANPVVAFSINDSSQQLTGNSFVFTSNTPTTGNTYNWNFGDGTTSTNANPTLSYTAAGPYVVKQIVTTANGCVDSFSYEVIVESDSVGSGGEGGLESEGLGGLVSARNYNRMKYSINRKVDYNKLPIFAAKANNYAAARGTGVKELPDMMPKQLEPGDVLRTSTPEDLVALTAASDVLAVDYTANNRAKAVVLGIKTYDKAYNHTKSICDRFRGAELLSVTATTINGYEFTRFALRQDDGTVEYAIAFVLGKKYNRNTYSLQTNWVISTYAAEDTLYNFQVWGRIPAYTDKLVKEILNNLDRSVEQFHNTSLPPAYITAGRRHQDTLIINVNNTTNITNAKIVFDEQINENAQYSQREVPLTLVEGSNNTFKINIEDGYEFEGKMYLNDVLVDEVYLADGNWGIDFDNHYTTINTFKRNNNPDRRYKEDEYPLYRNVTLDAKSSDYISIYKAIRPGTEKANLTAYSTLKFYAKGKGKVELRLTRDSIIDWKSQYKTTITLDENGKEYNISFDDFYSDNISTPFYAKDVKTMSFNFAAVSGTTENINFFVDNVSFSKEKTLAKRALQSKQVAITPIPNNGVFNMTFASDEDRELELQISDLSGKVVYTQKIAATTGMNTITVDTKASFPSATLLFTSLKGKGIKYDNGKMMIQ